MIKGNDVSTASPQKRDIGFVFQHYAAFKHLTVRDNVAFGSKIRKRPERGRRQGRRATRIVGLAGFRSVTRHSFPVVSASVYGAGPGTGGRSAGAAARRTVRALDAKVRDDLRKWLRRLHEEVGVTTVLVTHDQQEALDVS